MELVRGIPITRYCDDKRLTTGERLGLFISVCQAVQHAHQKGVIHRDLKPSNILVSPHDGVPVVKVIDFGVAKALGQQLTDKTLFTAFAQLIGTPLYMAPEQAELNALDIDTRTDVYSLGVLLYELLTGTTPFNEQRLRAARFDEMRRIIREEEPPKPSTRVSTLALAATTVSEKRKAEPQQLSRLLRGELDWVVMKSLEKDRDRRYESASALAADVGRYLHDEPVQACPPSAAYRVHKFARRHKPALVMSALAVLACVVLAGTVGWTLRDRAAQEAKMRADVERALDEAAERQRHAKWAEALAAVRVAEGLLSEGNGAPDLRERVAVLHRDLQMVARLEDIWLGQSSLRKDATFDLSGADAKYAAAFRDYGIDVERLEPAVAAQRIRAKGIRLQLIIALDDWTRVRRWDKNWDKARQGDSWRRLLAAAQAADLDEWRNHLRDVLARGLYSTDLALNIYPDDSVGDAKVPAVAERDRRTLTDLAASEQTAGQPPASLYLLARVLKHPLVNARDQAIALLRKAQRQYPTDFWVNFELGYLYHLAKPPQLEEAIRFYTVAIALRPESSVPHYYIGQILLAKGRLDEAIAALRERTRLQPSEGGAHRFLGIALVRNGQLDEGIAALRASFRLEPAAPGSVWGIRDLGQALETKGQLDEALTLYRDAVRLAPDSTSLWAALIDALRKKGEANEATAALREAVKLNADSAAFHNNLAWKLTTRWVSIAF
jgi:tetratricopeptide (TPR) repeat protein